MNMQKYTEGECSGTMGLELGHDFARALPGPLFQAKKLQCHWWEFMRVDVKCNYGTEYSQILQRSS